MGAGALGEERLGHALDTLQSESCVILHDRRIPRSRANPDHLVVTPTRVYVVDAKRYAGEVRQRDVGTFLRRDVRLYVGRRDCTKLIRASLEQAERVRAALADLEPRPRVVPVVCFVDSRWSLFARPLVIDGVIVTWPKALGKLIRNLQDRCGDGRVRGGRGVGACVPACRVSWSHELRA